jgi:hypothetical protein
MYTKRTFCLAVLLMASGMVGPASGQGVPSLLPIDTILKAREPLVRPDLQAKIAGINGQLPGPSPFRSLVIDRVQLETGALRGLTWLSETDDGTGLGTTTINDKTDYYWKVSYKIGLSELFKPRSSRAKLRSELAAAQAELKQALAADRREMLLKFNDFLEARAKFAKSSGGPKQTAEAAAGGVDRIEAGYLMRKRAIEMLILAGQDGGPEFEEWLRFRPEASEPQPTTLARR